MKETKTAILYSGSIYNVMQSIESEMKNLVVPNNADVFIVTERRTKRRRTATLDAYEEGSPEWHRKCASVTQDEGTITDEEIQYVKDTLGDRLKGFWIADDIPGYMDHLKNLRVKMMDSANGYRQYNLEHNIPDTFGSFFTSDDNGNLKCVVDQYNHVKKCYEYMVGYENHNGFKYDYVIRARIDFVVPEVIDIEQYTLPYDGQYVHIMGSVNRDPFEFSDEFCWFSKRQIADRLFPHLDRMGMMCDRKYNTIDITSNRDMRFAAETQFALLQKELALPVINTKIYRSNTFTNSADGSSYFNYMYREDPIDIEDQFALACSTSSDINEHLPKMREIASQCSHIIEMGTRYGNSTIAFMAGRPEKFIAYDVQYNSRMDLLKKVARDNGINFDMRIEDVLQIELEETDLLFIDTNHNKEQCSVELEMHAGKARKYIMFHDTTSFWERGQGWWEEPGHGLKDAIEPFLAAHPEWKMEYRAMNNNGLMILKRI